MRELRQHASKYLERVERGEAIEVTNHGRLVARLVPANGELSGIARLEALGAITEAEGDLLDIEPVPLPPGATPPSEMVSRMRDE